MYKSQATRANLEHSLQRLKKADLVALLGEAFEQLPKTRREVVFGDLLDPPSAGSKKHTKASRQRLLRDVTSFHTASLKEHYREDFNVNSKNWRDESEGTAKWRREVNRLFDRAIAASTAGDPQHVCSAFELLFDLLLRLDDGEDFIFFADEGGSWQIMANYDTIFPAYFACLAAVADPDDYARRSCSVIAAFEDHEEAKYLKVARSKASAKQKTAIAKYLKSKPESFEARQWLTEALRKRTAPHPHSS